MRTLLVILGLGALGYFAWQNYLGGPPQVIEDAVCAEVRGRYAKLFDDVPIPSTYLSMTRAPPACRPPADEPLGYI
jgi:hypothetical protein